MKWASHAAALAGVLLLLGSKVAADAMGGCHPRRPCAVDLSAVCPGVTPGGGRLAACLTSQMSALSTGCSTIVSREVYVATECEADLARFCSGAKSGSASVAACIRPHLREASASCREALAFIDAPGSLRQ
jgi:hypothetical protein